MLQNGARMVTGNWCLFVSEQINASTPYDSIHNINNIIFFFFFGFQLKRHIKSDIVFVISCRCLKFSNAKSHQKLLICPKNLVRRRTFSLSAAQKMCSFCLKLYINICDL